MKPVEKASGDHGGGRRLACPICDKPAVPAWRPFCSRRCADIDLNRWLSEAYSIPGPPATNDDGTA